jgi:tRNA U38,U39,U40 pseudouridine synthase TruA
MQRNPGFPTIEEELERALVKAGAIPEEYAGSFVGVSGRRGTQVAGHGSGGVAGHTSGPAPLPPPTQLSGTRRA